MPLLEHLYTASLHLLQGAFPLLGRGEGKLARGVRGRREVLARMEAWARRERDPARPLVWFHAASVGEGLQARAVMEAFRARRPGVQLAYTHFSPSAEGLARRVPADFADYLPLDLPGGVGPALDLLRPSVLAFSKTDVWPNLTREAARRGVRMALLSATLPASSSLLTGVARRLVSPAHRRLDRVAAISTEDAKRFARLGVEARARSVMGDAHFDRVLARADGVDRGSALLARLAGAGRRVLVAGSTWAADEERLLPVVAGLAGGGEVGLVLVPHEPTPGHLAQSERRLGELGLPVRRLAALTGGWDRREVLLVDRVGVLGEIYAAADVAYVGGGWGTAGLHSVLEPAAFGLPILFGPRHRNAREAGELAAVGAAFPVSSVAELSERLGDLLRSPTARSRAGAAARAYVEAGRGAAERGAAVLEELIDGGL
jgi:3-deoxy-D-manno-octulosonic-acid transferase